MRFFVITRAHLLFATPILLGVFLMLLFTNHNEFQILNILGFLFLALVPGMLTMFSLRLKILPFFAKLSFSVAFSLLELMVLGLVGNYLLPRFGIAQPLGRTALAVEITILLIVLCLIVWRRLADWKFNVGSRLFKIFSSKSDVLLSLFPIIFVFQSIIGAFNLNNGGTGLWTFAMLGEIAVYSLILFLYVRKIGENTIPTALFFVSLSLLFMTSLRGWYITGHDIQIEYKVFELTKNANFWNIDFYRDAYNACLSITILPTIFYNLLRVSDLYIYKFLFQFFFALCPGIAYLVSRHWADKRISFLTAFYFIAFPTFFVDMPFLVRQEVAFIFYGLMIYLIFNKKLDMRIRRILFLVMGIGVILSHYSTTYTILFFFTLTAVSRPIFTRLINFFNKKFGLFRKSSLSALPSIKIARDEKKITFTMIVVLALASFLWTSVITNTGGNLSKVLKETIYAVGSGFTENTRSTDATNLLSFRKPSQQDELDAYIKKVINPIRKALPGAYYDESEYSKYLFIALPDEQLPLTKFGGFVQKSGIDFVLLMTIFGRILAKLMEVLAPLGVLYLLFRKLLLKKIDVEFYLLAIYALFFIFLIILVPVLSTEYGIYRAMQQSMYVLALPMVIGSQMIGSWIGRIKQLLHRFYFKMKGLQMRSFSRARGGAFAVILALLFFLYSTSFILQIFGKNPAVLYLSNTGRYYDNYLIKTPEVYGVDWLTNIANNNLNSISGVKIKIQTDRYSQRKIASLSSLDAYNDIFPGVVRKDAYVFLGQATTRKQRATLVYGGDQVTYTYPIQFLDEKKNLIYNNGSAKIYR